MVEDVVGIVRRLHVHEPVVDRVAVRLADPSGSFIAAEKIDIDALPELAERGEEISLQNAAFVLSIGLRSRPDAWTITAEELPALWAEFTAERVQAA